MGMCRLIAEIRPNEFTLRRRFLSSATVAPSKAEPSQIGSKCDKEWRLKPLTKSSQISVDVSGDTLPNTFSDTYEHSTGELGLNEKVRLLFNVHWY